MSEKEGKIRYSEVVRDVYKEGKYFEDAMDWYCLKYLNAISERTFFIILSIMSVIIVILLYITFDNIMPLKEEFPVLVTQKDSVNYYTIIEAVKPEKMNYNSNEAILRLLLIRYVRELFNHNYKSGNIEDLNEKLLKIRNYSTDEVLQKFRNDFNQISANMFNKNIEQRVYIKTFKFKEKNNENSKKNKVISLLSSYIFTKKIPSEAEMEYEIHIITNNEKKVIKQKILLDFKYEAIKYNNLKKDFTKPILIVTNYRTVDIK